MYMRPKNRTPRARRRDRGALLVDVLIGMFLFVMTALAILSLFPVIKRGEQMSTEESKAIQMCNRLIEHVQMLPANDITIENLTALNLIDDDQSAQPLSFTHVPLDEASRYSPAQALRDSDAELSFAEIDGGSVRVLITMTYTTDSGFSKTINTGTVVGAFR